MKTFFYIILIFFTFDSHAGEFTNFGKVLFQRASTWVAANNVCTDQNKLYHKSVETIDRVRCTGREGDVCEVWDTEELVQNIQSMRVRCSRFSEGDCVLHERVSFNQNVNVRVEVYNNYRSFEEHEPPKDSYWYRIPECR